MTCKSAIHRDCDVLTTTEERLTKKEATGSRVHERLAKSVQRSHVRGQEKRTRQK